MSHSQLKHIHKCDSILLPARTLYNFTLYSKRFAVTEKNPLTFNSLDFFLSPLTSTGKLHRSCGAQSQKHRLWPKQNIKLPIIVVKEESCEKADSVSDRSGKKQNKLYNHNKAQQYPFICRSSCLFFYFYLLYLFHFCGGNKWQNCPEGHLLLRASSKVMKYC